MKKLFLFLVLGLCAQEAVCSHFVRQIPGLRLLTQKRTIYHSGERSSEKNFKDRILDSVVLAGLVGFGVNALYNKMTNDGELARIEKDLQQVKAKQQELLDLMREIRNDQIRQGAVSDTVREMETKFPSVFAHLVRTNQVPSSFANDPKSTDQAGKEERK